MKDLSLFLLKNSVASKMRRGLRNFCNNTSTLNQTNTSTTTNLSSCTISTIPASSSQQEISTSPKTLEEMLLQLDLEEAAARRAKMEDYGELNRRMSCVNNSDILRLSRNALNQYPRFSLDGRDAMYRSSFRRDHFDHVESNRGLRMPAMVAGECVVWCKPGVVAKLMGLEAVPVPVNRTRRLRNQNQNQNQNQNLSLREVFRSRNLRRMERCELEKNRVGMMMMRRRRRREESTVGSSETMATTVKGCCVMKPLMEERERVRREEWVTRRCMHES